MEHVKIRDFFLKKVNRKFEKQKKENGNFYIFFSKFRLVKLNV